MAYDYKIRKVHFIKKRSKELEDKLISGDIDSNYFKTALKNYKKELLIFEQEKLFPELWEEVVKLKKEIDEWCLKVTDDFNELLK